MANTKKGNEKENPYRVGVITPEELDGEARKGLDLLGKICSGTASENEAKAGANVLKTVGEATRRINSQTRDGELRLRAAKAAGATPEEVRPIFRQIAGQG